MKKYILIYFTKSSKATPSAKFIKSIQPYLKLISISDNFSDAIVYDGFVSAFKVLREVEGFLDKRFEGVKVLCIS